MTLAGVPQCIRRDCTATATRLVWHPFVAVPWPGCDAHWPAMLSAFKFGLPDSTQPWDTEIDQTPAPF